MARGDLGFIIAIFFVLGVSLATVEIRVWWVLILAAGWMRLSRELPSRMFRSSGLAGAIALTVGYAYFFLFWNWQIMTTNIPYGVSEWEGTAISVEHRDTHTSAEIALAEPWRGKVRVILPTGTILAYGEILKIQGEIRRSDRSGEAPFAAYPRLERTGLRGGSWIMRQLWDLREWFNGQLRIFLAGDAALLAAGLTLGIREFGHSLREAMAQSGTSHLVALSGYNVAILVVAISRLLGSWLSRRSTFLATTACIALFVMMTGAESSIVRAALMGFLALLAMEAGRIYSFRNAITLTATVMVAFDPAVLRLDLGFLLSFLSLLGIAYLAPLVTRFLNWQDKDKSGWSWQEQAALTIGAQLAVIPILLVRFETFAPAAILANVIILPLIPITMFLSFITVLAGALLPVAGAMVGWIAGGLLDFELWIIRAFAPWSIRLPVSIGWLEILAYYGLLAWMIFRASRSERHQARHLPL